MFCTFASRIEIYLNMLYYIRKYPVSLLIILTVIYLSFFKPPQTEMESIPGIDKVVHVCMYFGMSGMLWLEFIRAHKKHAYRCGTRGWEPGSAPYCSVGR